MTKRNSNSEMTPEARARMVAGSKAGSKLVSEKFAERVTRKKFCEEVGIHASTLKRWEKAGAVNPQVETVLGSPTVVFESSDLERGRRIAKLLKDNLGEMSLRRAVAIVDGHETV